MDDVQPPLEQRIRASMALAGLSYLELAERIRTEGLGEHVLRNLANPNHRRQGRPHELRLIAEACNVPYWFLSEGFSEPAAADDRVAELEAQMAAVALLLPLLVKAAGYELPPRAAQALARVQSTKG
jgi:transcriptional regulator with XRE-family HTH domain